LVEAWRTLLQPPFFAALANHPDPLHRAFDWRLPASLSGLRGPERPRPSPTGHEL